MAFGTVVREERAKSGVSQDELAEMAGMHRTGLSKIERGLLQPSLQAIIGLSAALGRDPVEIILLTMQKLRSVGSHQAAELADRHSG
jgi:transcriptional regulator with XRE-family HTH domain